VSLVKIAVVGNCQARPLALAVAQLVPSATISGIAIVHLVNDTQAEEYGSIFTDADIILAQRVVDNYPCTFVRTSNLALAYGEKVVSWPNLYFSGYNPELFYLKGPDRRNATGPLGEYHVREIHQAWMQGKLVGETVALMSDAALHEKHYATAADESISELAKREEQTDVKISDWVLERRWQKQLFFTFNHPSNLAILKTARLLLKRAEVSMSESNALVIAKKEALGKILCPINPYIKSKYSLAFQQSDRYKGQAINYAAGTLVLGESKLYNLKDLVETFFAVYGSTSVAQTASRS
jgi:hypothetical protein